MSHEQSQEDAVANLPPEGILKEQSFKKYGRYYGKWPQTDAEPIEPNYLFPIDAEEELRLDIWHKFMLTVRDGRLFEYDLPNCIQKPKILDLGTGTGIWANDVAQLLRAQGTPAQIMAVDINRIQAKTVPEDVTVLQADLEDASWEGLTGTGVIDGVVMRGGRQAMYTNCHLIHLGFLLGSIRTDAWGDLYQRVADALDPTYGYVEQVEIDWVPKWKDNIVPEGGRALRQWSERFSRAMQGANRSVWISSEERRALMMEAGLTYVDEKIISCPISPWNGEKENTPAYEKVKWFNLAFTRSLRSLSRWPMTAYYLAAGTNLKGERFDDSIARLERETTLLAELAELNADAEGQSMNTAFPAYYNVHIWVAKKTGPQ